jgi:hypothetical protein
LRHHIIFLSPPQLNDKLWPNPQAVNSARLFRTIVFPNPERLLVSFAEKEVIIVMGSEKHLNTTRTSGRGSPAFFLRLLASSLAVWGAVVMACCSSSNDGGSSEDGGGPAVCGNERKEGEEQCDGADLGGESCESLGYEQGGVLSCTDTCRFEASECVGEGRCGNGINDEVEECDGPDMGELTCWTRAGLMDGELTCAEDCTADTSGCHTCGDRIVQGPEECDDINLGGGSCVDLGFQGGHLACSPDCVYDTGGCTSTPTGWYDEAWAYRLPLKVEYLRVETDLTDFPAAVVLTGLELSEKVQPMGQDIIFTSADGQTKLAHEIERVDGDEGVVVAWVLFDFISSSEHTSFFMYYGNPGCSSQQSPGQVWDSHHVGVWHLGEETVDGAVGGSHRDSTANGRYATQYGNGITPGVVGDGQHFDGSGDYIEIGDPDTVPLGDTDCTVSAWIRTSSTSPMGLLVKSANGVDETGAKLIGLNHGQGALGVDHTGASYLESSLFVADSAWHHIAWTQVKDASGNLETWKIYIDGELDVSADVATLADVAGHTLHLGGLVAESRFPARFLGDIDEVRISNVARDPGYLAAQYRNQKDVSAFVTAGTEQAFSSN